MQLHPSVDYARGLRKSLSPLEIQQILKARGYEFSSQGKLSWLTLESSLPETAPSQTEIIWHSKWKASYMVAEVDSRRTRLTHKELSGIDWSFKFKQWMAEENLRARFRDDFTLWSDVIEMDEDFGHTLQWCFEDDGVRVEHFPLLIISRADDWGFVMQNRHVILYSS
ncbi:hypothetical protein HDU84_009816 [Entophlyctis sp. JEL0112]|nr:hypothetical protein HDU84_009816 [Entophlyctis sp. JEL0112]